MTMGDCAGSQHGQPGHGTPADCTMACASALPAMPIVLDAGPERQARDLCRPAVSAKLFGTVLEIATPPPRLA